MHIRKARLDEIEIIMTIYNFARKVYCGRIFVADGSARIAFQKVNDTRALERVEMSI